MTNIDDFNHRGCNKIDANCINAYVDFHKDKDNPTGICLESSWGGDCLDLSDIIKAGETVTTLQLEPTDNPTCLVFHREDGGADCIHGDDLSRIISMKYLKDVDQNKRPSNGDVLMYKDGKFYTFNLQEYMDNTGTTINNIKAAHNQVKNQLDNLREEFNTLKGQLEEIINRWHLPADIPDDAKILLGNINIYSDYNASINGSGSATSLNKNHGVYGHDLNTDKNYDEIFG